MKSVGEAMSFGRNFKEAFQKAIRSLETGRAGFGADGKDDFPTEYLLTVKGDEKKEVIDRVVGKIKVPRNDNIFYIRYAMLLGVSVDEIYEATKIDKWFLCQLRDIVDLEKEMYQYSL